MIYVGTSGWSYPKGAGAWDGTFYPPKLADKDKLTFYAQYFNTVEINSSFYRPPSPHAARAWASKVPDDFRFTAKLWQKFTHPKMFEAATGQAARVEDEDFDVFAEGIGPLAEAGKLGPLLAQFPASFRPDAQTLAYLEDLIRRMRGRGLSARRRATPSRMDGVRRDRRDPRLHGRAGRRLGDDRRATLQDVDPPRPLTARYGVLSLPRAQLQELVAARRRGRPLQLPVHA